MSDLTDGERFDEWFMRTRDMGPDGDTPDEVNGPIYLARRSGFDFALSLVSKERDEAAHAPADLDDAQQQIAMLTAENERLSALLNESPSALRAQVQFLETKSEALESKLANMTADRDSYQRAADRYRAHAAEVREECVRLWAGMREAIARCDMAILGNNEYAKSRVAVDLLPILRSALESPATLPPEPTARPASSWPEGRAVLVRDNDYDDGEEPTTPKPQRIVTDFVCPHCGARPGQSCNTLAGYHYERFMCSAISDPAIMHFERSSKAFELYDQLTGTEHDGDSKATLNGKEECE